jgi:NAD(P)-dependent dehydrogenase (short-subunit alcohol dehydrogenase family)
MERPLEGRIAVVAGGTRGAGRGISVELGAAGATVYVTGRSSRAGLSPMGRPETIEETAEMVEAQGGRGIAVRVDHSRPEEVRRLFERIGEERNGQLHILVNDIWGGESLTQFDTPFWELSLEDGIAMLRQGIETHLITSHYAAPLMVRRKSGLILEITDGVGEGYRGSLFYDLVKTSVIRLALAQAVELRQHKVAALALTPGFLRSEEMLEHFGVTEANWQDATRKDPHLQPPRRLPTSAARWQPSPPILMSSTAPARPYLPGSSPKNTASPTEMAVVQIGGVTCGSISRV